MPAWWPFKRKPDIASLTEAFIADLKQQVQEQRAAHISRQALIKTLEIQTRLWEARSNEQEAQARLRAIRVIYQELQASLQADLQQGKNLEEAGDLEGAIACYETAVSDQIAVRFPYTRLFELYTQQGNYKQAQRVCQTAVSNPFLPQSARQHFQAKLNQLEAIHE
ncbi:MAG: hypothetical protein D6706_19355 [Chloroflexi bacterium]|nr:MAG: hypothetical protein D6706_19355 [Chloroflexota bacterium]